MPSIPATWCLRPAAPPTVRDLSVPGDGIHPAEPAGAAIVRPQGLVDAVRADAGPMPVALAQITPARARLDTVYGAQGAAAQAKWAAINAAIAGQGATPVTGEDGRLTAHVATLDDGAGALAAAYDMGDGVTPTRPAVR